MEMTQREKALMAYARRWSAAWTYTNSRPQKLYPERYGESDCSGFIWAAYKAIGVDLADIDMSYEMSIAGVHVASGKTAADFTAIQDKLRPGDLICMSVRTGYRGGTAINHVEMYSDMPGYSFGHGGYPSPGPTLQKTTASWLLGGSAFWTVRRILTADATPTQPAGKLPVNPLDLEEEMIIIKAPNRPAALIGPGTFHVFRNSEEQEVTLRTLSPKVVDTLNARQYDVTKSVVLASAVDARSTTRQLEEIYAALDTAE